MPWHEPSLIWHKANYNTIFSHSRLKFWMAHWVSDFSVFSFQGALSYGIHPPLPYLRIQIASLKLQESLSFLLYPWCRSFWLLVALWWGDEIAFSSSSNIPYWLGLCWDTATLRLLEAGFKSQESICAYSGIGNSKSCQSCLKSILYVHHKLS